MVSTLGFEQDDIDRLAAIEGVEKVLPARSVDVMATMGSTRWLLVLWSFRPQPRQPLKKNDVTENDVKEGASALISRF